MLIINGKILTMAAQKPENSFRDSDAGSITEGDTFSYDGGFVYAAEGKIKAVGPMRELAEEIREENAGQDGIVLDVDGAWVMPGLIDAHCHVGMTEEKWGMAGEDCNEATMPITPHLRALDAVNPMDPAFHDAIIAGVTSLMTGPGSSNVVGGQSLFMKVQGRCIDNMVVKAPAAMKVAFGENPKNDYGEKGVMPASRMAIAGMLRKELYEACRYQERWDKGEIGPGDRDFRMECWLPVLRGEIPLKAHVHRADDILTAIRIAKEYNLRMTLDHCTEGHLIADEMKASGFPAIVGPDLSARSKIEIKNMSFKTAGVLERAGVKTAIMTDHPVSLIRYLPLCAGLSVKQGLSFEGGLRAVTIHAAQICGVDGRVGSLEAGKDADIAVFSGNPLEVSAKTLYTVIDGKVVYEAGL